ncbi:MAG: hypothetical protein WHS83_10915 [Chloroflexus sp.]|uniref:hypothetical protein n=1 Tax=Chloroflexus sp. TaxID=1904827 RepID=UPI0030A59C8E
MPWLIARYQPTSLFSLKHGDATSTGGKSLLVPTPFAIRMALLDAAIRTKGIGVGPQAFNLIKSLRLAIRLPSYAAVTSIFVRVLKPERPDSSGRRAGQESATIQNVLEPEQEEGDGPNRGMIRTIAFREYVHLSGELTLAFGGENKTLLTIRPWLMQINYFGKRGSFYQLLASPEIVETEKDDIPVGFLSFPGHDLLSGVPPKSFPLGLIQRVDEWGESLRFEQANIYNRDRRASIKVGKERIRADVILPYQMVRASRGMALYKRFEVNDKPEMT